jgi:hypothetical protein
MHSRCAVHTDSASFLASSRNQALFRTRCRLSSTVSARVSLRRGGRPFKTLRRLRSSGTQVRPLAPKYQRPPSRKQKSIPSVLHISSPDMSCFKERAKSVELPNHGDVSMDPRRPPRAPPPARGPQAHCAARKWVYHFFPANSLPPALRGYYALRGFCYTPGTKG